MKPHCPVCKGPLTRLKEHPGPARRYRCDHCGALSWVSASHIGRLFFFAIVPVVLVMYLLLRHYLDAPSYLGHLFGYAMVAVMILLHEVLIVRFAPPELVPQSADVPATEVSFLDALGMSRLLRIFFHMDVWVTIVFVPQFWRSEERTWFDLLIPLSLWIMSAVHALSLRCPSCRQRLLPLDLRRWSAMFRVKTCPYCDFKPETDPQLIEPRTWVGKVGLGGAYVAAFAAAAVLFMRTVPQIDFPPLDAPAQGEARLDWKMETLDGNVIDAASLRGKPLFLNLWASWCGPCRQEMPSIARLHKAIGDDMTIACVSEEPVNTLRQYASDRNLDLPFYRVEARPNLFGERGVPHTYIIDAAGRIRFEHVGAADWGSPQAVAYLHGLTAEAREGMPMRTADARGEQMPVKP